MTDILPIPAETLASPAYMGDLGDGLIRRWSTAADQPKIAERMGVIYRSSPDEPPNPRSLDSARVLMSGDFPYMGPGDFAVIEDTHRPDRPIIAYACLWRLRWRYGDIPFGVGQPEMVATDPAYRNRGLIRALFEMLHARSATEGHLAQAITGIPYFYRQLGYEYVLDLEGSRVVPVAAIAEKADDQPEPYQLREATLDDVPQLTTFYAQSRGASLIWHDAPETFWHHHIAAWDDAVTRSLGPLQTILHGKLYMVIDSAGVSVGFVRLAAKRWNQLLRVFLLHLDQRVNWQSATPCLLRALREYGQHLPVTERNTKPFSGIDFELGRAHPLYVMLDKTLPLRTVPPYAWYLRVADIPAFIRHIAPVLEERLAQSLLVGHTGELTINFYRGGLRLRFTQGKLTEIEPWRAPAYGDEGDAGCPSLVFLQLLFGYRSFAELNDFFPDVWASEQAAPLIDTLFPMQHSVVHALNNA